MSYYIRRNERPEHRAALRLAVNAGSVLEEDDQRGLAHLARAHGLQRHQALRAAASWSGSWNPSGCASAPTPTRTPASTRRCTCSRCPPTAPASSRRASTVLADFAGGWTLEQERDRQGARRRARGMAAGPGRDSRAAAPSSSPSLMHGSRYAERLPIGDPDVIKSSVPRACAPSTTNGTGPTGWPSSSSATSIPSRPRSGSRTSLATSRRRGPQGRARLRHPQPSRDPGQRRHRSGGARLRRLRDLQASEASGRPGRRLPAQPGRDPVPFDGELAPGRDGAPRGRALPGRLVLGGLDRPRHGHRGARRRGGGRRIATGLRALLTEAERVRVHGFAAAELDRAKRELRAQYERAWRSATRARAAPTPGSTSRTS